jgi:hypothetical protein
VLRRLAVCAFIAGCTTNPDSRPATTDYIIEAILVPYCGRGGCHSTDTAARNLIFDTPEQARIAMSKTDHGMKLVVPGMPDKSELYTALSDSRRIMPPDIPLPDKDRELIFEWISNLTAAP